MTEAPTLTQLLHQEHLRTLAVINELETRITAPRARPMDPTNPQERRCLEELIRMLDNDILRHYRFEEEALFPRLAGIGLAPVTEMLSMEHDAVRAMADALRSAAADALKSSFTPPSWSAFRDTFMDLLHSVSFHIQKEEMGVIQQLEPILGSALDCELGAIYAAYV